MDQLSHSTAASSRIHSRAAALAAQHSQHLQPLPSLFDHAAQPQLLEVVALSFTSGTRAWLDQFFLGFVFATCLQNG